MDLLQPQGGEQHVADGVTGRVWLTCCAWCARTEVMESWVENAAAVELISVDEVDGEASSRSNR